MLQNLINQLNSPWNVIAWIALAAVVLVICWLLTKLNKTVFKRIQKKNNALHLLFLQHLISIFIVIGFIVLVVSSFAGMQSVWTTIFGGTAILSAVIAFAAQDVIKDILAGIMISAHRPFEIGDRITLDDGTAGIVEDMTLRHVVLKSTEALRIIVPNSVINTKSITNLSFKTDIRSVKFDYPVGYDSDLEKVKELIRKAVEESEYTVEGFEDKDGNKRYGDVYFMDLASSALMIRFIVYYLPTTPTEIVIDDVNSRVRKALLENGIEIPYNYINVVEKTEENKPKTKSAKSLFLDKT